MTVVFIVVSVARAVLMAGDRGDEHAPYSAADLVILEMLLTNEGATSVQVTNSRIVIRSSGIDRVAGRGRAVVPNLVRIMKTDELSFDTFVRCFVTCENILHQSRPSASLFWSGGADLERREDGSVRIVPGGQEDERAFRAKVVRDIEEKVLETE
jgi:hypothetical protein